MGLQDRDYYQAEVRKRDTNNVFDTAKRINPGKNPPPTYAASASSTGWGLLLLRTVVICLAVYGALALVRDFRTGLWPWMSVDSGKVQRLLPYLSGT